MAKPDIMAALGGDEDLTEAPESPESEDTPDAKVEAARDALDAIKNDDENAYAAAFKRMYDACAAEHGTEGDDLEGY